MTAGFSKADVRDASRALGLRTWDKPAAACLASRIPHGTPVSVGLLSTIDRAEAALKALGFADVRVRHYGETARIEVGVDELAPGDRANGLRSSRRSTESAIATSRSTSKASAPGTSTPASMSAETTVWVFQPT